MTRYWAVEKLSDCFGFNSTFCTNWIYRAKKSIIEYLKTDIMWMLNVTCSGNRNESITINNSFTLVFVAATLRQKPNTTRVWAIEKVQQPDIWVNGHNYRIILRIAMQCIRHAQQTSSTNNWYKHSWQKSWESQWANHSKCNGSQILSMKVLSALSMQNVQKSSPAHNTVCRRA